MSNAFFNKVQTEIESYGFAVADKDFSRPWGGFLALDVKSFAPKGNTVPRY